MELGYHDVGEVFATMLGIDTPSLGTPALALDPSLAAPSASQQPMTLTQPSMAIPSAAAPSLSPGRLTAPSIPIVAPAPSAAQQGIKAAGSAAGVIPFVGPLLSAGIGFVSGLFSAHSAADAQRAAEQAAESQKKQIDIQQKDAVELQKKLASQTMSPLAAAKLRLAQQRLSQTKAHHAAFLSLHPELAPKKDDGKTQKMSTGKKVAIGTGVAAAVVGGAWWFTGGNLMKVLK